VKKAGQKSGQNGIGDNGAQIEDQITGLFGYTQMGSRRPGQTIEGNHHPSLGGTITGIGLAVHALSPIPGVVLLGLGYRQGTAQGQRFRLEENHILIDDIQMAAGGQQEHR
jgi:hypothetical protein